MSRFITKPNSKIDKRIIFAFTILANFNDVELITQLISISWLKVVLTIVISIIIPCVSYFLYYRKYDKDFVNIKLSKKVAKYLDYSHFCFCGNNDMIILDFDIPKACKIIDEICNATIVPIEMRKPLYDKMCSIWTEYGGGSSYFVKVYTIPGFITEKWKRAIIEYKKYEIEND